nr:FAD-linked oxidoreductase [Penicillium sclerotiorum]
MKKATKKHACNILEALFGPYVSPGTEIASSSDANFSSVVTGRWTSWEAPTFSGAIKPVTEHDLQEIVRIASANHIPFLATSGGHGAGLGYASVTGLDINLANFNCVSVDVDRNELVVGAGVSIGDLTEPLYEAGKAVPHGNENCVGFLGATLGGGIGVGTGILGLGVDSLKSARVLVASGDIVTASEHHHPDLFWAIRGAGANFGIVVSATFELQEQANDGNTVTASFTYDGAKNASVLEFFRSFDDTLPDELAITLHFSYNTTLKQSQVALDYVYFGQLSDVQQYIDAANALGPLSSSHEILTIPELYESLEHNECTINSPISGATAGIGEIDVPTFQAIFAEFVAFAAANPTTYVGESAWQRYSNKKALAQPANSTSFPWRDIKAYWLHLNVFLSPTIEDAVTNMTLSLREKLNAGSGFDTPHVYVNYAYGDEGPAAWWSAANLPRLRALKARWDPRNLFGKANSVLAQ